MKKNLRERMEKISYLYVKDKNHSILEYKKLEKEIHDIMGIEKFNLVFQKYIILPMYEGRETILQEEFLEFFRMRDSFENVFQKHESVKRVYMNGNIVEIPRWDAEIPYWTIEWVNIQCIREENLVEHNPRNETDYIIMNYMWKELQRPKYKIFLRRLL